MKELSETSEKGLRFFIPIIISRQPSYVNLKLWQAKKFNPLGVFKNCPLLKQVGQLHGITLY